MKQGILCVLPHLYIASHPTMLQLVQSLSRQWAFVEVMSPAGSVVITENDDPASAKPSWPRLTANPYRVRYKFNRLRQACGKMLLVARRQRYAAVIGVDPEGIGLAHRLNQHLRKKLVYASFELLFADEVQDSREEKLKALELEASSFVDLVLVQDDLREKWLRRNNQFRYAQFCHCPVAPMPRRQSRSNFLRETLGIPADKRIILLAGSVEPFTSRDLLHEMVSCWPENYQLVVNCRASITKRERLFMDDLAKATGRVSITEQPAPMDSVIDIFGSADFALLSYKPVPGSWMSYKNIYHIGLSSGKAAYAAMCGVPMIASALPTYVELFSRFKCGKTYNHVREIPELLVSMEKGYSMYSQEARRCYRELMDPTDGIKQFCQQLQQIACS